MAVILEGRLISRDRMLKDGSNQVVTFYSINTVKGWKQVRFDKAVNLKKIEVPGLVKIEVTSARVKTDTTEKGTFTNTSVYAVSCDQVDSLPEFEAYEQSRLEEKLDM